MNNKSHTVPTPVSAENTSRFLDYLSVSLSKFKFEGGEGSHLPDGGFQEKFRCLLPITSEYEIPAVWTITLKSDGTLAPFEVSVDESAPEEWQRVVEDTIRNTLVDLINGISGKFFQRHFFAYIGPLLDGEYYITDFRIAPSQPTSAFPFGLGEEILIIDLEAEGINPAHALALGRVQAKKIASLLSVFLNVGFYTIPTAESRWVYYGDDGCKCFQLGYKSSIRMPSEIPRNGIECKAGDAYEVDRNKMEEIFKPNEVLRCPRDIRVLFRTFHSLSPNEQAAYIGAASLFQIALVAGRHYPTVHMAYSVAAVDSLTKEHSMNSFLQLVCNLCPELQADDVEYFYRKCRSAHFHAGALPGGEFEPTRMTLLMTPRRDEFVRMTLPRYTREAMRTVLIRWLLKRAAT
jgi:hypothetical protein